MYSSDIRVHFIDAPGYDDASPSVTGILKEMADWMSQPNRANVQFGGIICFRSILELLRILYICSCFDLQVVGCMNFDPQ